MDVGASAAGDRGAAAQGAGEDRRRGCQEERGMSFIDVRQSSEQSQAARPACVASGMSRRGCHIERLCSMGIGSDTTYFIPPPPPPIDAQLGRIPAVHASAIAANHLNVR
jgi:hypothetical protein